MVFQFLTDHMVLQVKTRIQVKFLKGKKMAGHMGAKFRTILNLEIIKSDLENSLLYIKGSIPGSKNSVVLFKKISKNI